MPEIELTDEQKIAANHILEWVNGGLDRRKVLSGYAGTGKTFLTNYISRRLNIPVAYCAFTGKAASILGQNIEMKPSDYCGTIHRLIYIPKEEEYFDATSGKQVSKIRWIKRYSLDDYSLIVIDEGSMISQNIYRDLDNYNKPILVIGDEAQLPPIDDSFNLMSKPDFRLTKIHRQAEGSPIIQLSFQIREGQRVDYKKWNDDVVVCRSGTEFDRGFLDNYDQEFDIVICGYNKERCDLNKQIRKKLGYNHKEPMLGERVICLRNNAMKGIFNGMIGKISSICRIRDRDVFRLNVDFGDGFIVDDLVCPQEQFGSTSTKNELAKKGFDLFDWAYSITCHKSQGSQFDNVMVINAGNTDLWEPRRWLYTAVTRAKKKLVLVM